MRRVPFPLRHPWAITEQGLQLIVAVWSRGDLFASVKEKALEAREGAPLQNTHATTIRDGVAIIPIEGPLFRKAGLMTDISGATAYSDLRKDFQRALEDESVRAIVLDVCSPGGEVDGCDELAQAIFQARGRKPIKAYVGGLGASAAYWLSSAADEIVCAETASLGSIGVRTTLMDDSARDAAEGIKEIPIISSKSPGKRDQPVDDEVVARAQAHVDQLADVFYETVARHRGVSVETVLSDFGQGDVLIGKAAVAAKLADRVGNLEDLLRELTGTASAGHNTPKGETSMRTRQTSTAARPAARSVRAEGAPNDPPKGKHAEEKAEDKPPEGEAEGEEMEGEAEAAECSECHGSGKVDGEECESCGGSGKAEFEGEAEADDDGDEDDKPKKKEEAEGDDKKEEASFRRLAAKLGLPATASRHEVLLAAQAGAVPVASVEALVDKRVKEQLAKDAAARKKADAVAKANRLLTAASRGGWDGDKEERADLVALASVNYKAAERILGGYLKANADLGRRTMGQDRDDESATGGVRVSRVGAFEIHRHGSAFASAAKKLAAKEGLKYEAAMDRVKREQPQLWDAYINGQ